MLSALRALLPRACPGCGSSLGREAGLCRACLESVRPQLQRHSMLSNNTAPHLVILGQHKGLLRRAARELKYGGHRDLAWVLGQALASGVPQDWHLSAVSAVPMHPTRQRERGFNHAELLARQVADALELPYLESLRRVRHTTQQARLSGAARLGNLAGAFASQGAELQLSGQMLPQPILLIDDVMTTGATLRACRDALHAGGVNEVFYAVITR